MMSRQARQRTLASVPGDAPAYGQDLSWQPAKPRLHPVRLLVAWVVDAAAVYVAAALLPGFSLERLGSAFLVAAVIAVFNAVLPPLVAALRLPFTLALGFVLVLLVDAFALVLADDLLPRFGEVDGFGSALLAALVISAITMVLEVILGTNDNDEYAFRVVRRVARRQGALDRSDVPGIVFLEIDGLGLPVLQRALRDGHTPKMARWLASGTHQLVEWETDLSSQTGASQAGILLGSNDDIPAFRWVEKETGTLMVCSSPEDCAEIERRHATGAGLLAGGGSSRGNLLSGEAAETILTVSRSEAERRANPGYRAFFANGFNVTRVLVLFAWEVVLELTAAARARHRDVRPRGHRGGIYPLMRAAMCVLIRDLIVYAVMTDMMRGRPVVYATFSSYDEVAHHSGLERIEVAAQVLRALVDPDVGQVRNFMDAALCFTAKHRDQVRSLLATTKLGTKREDQAISAIMDDMGTCIPANARRISISSPMMPSSSPARAAAWIVSRTACAVGSASSWVRSRSATETRWPAGACRSWYGLVFASRSWPLIAST